MIVLTNFLYFLQMVITLKMQMIFSFKYLDASKVLFSSILKILCKKICLSRHITFHSTCMESYRFPWMLSMPTACFFFSWPETSWRIKIYARMQLVNSIHIETCNLFLFVWQWDEWDIYQMSFSISVVYQIHQLSVMLLLSIFQWPKTADN